MIVKCMILYIKEYDFDEIMQVNVKAPFMISQHVSKYMKKNGGGKIAKTGHREDRMCWIYE